MTEDKILENTVHIKQIWLLYLEYVFSLYAAMKSLATWFAMAAGVARKGGGAPAKQSGRKANLRPSQASLEPRVAAYLQRPSMTSGDDWFEREMVAMRGAAARLGLVFADVFVENYVRGDGTARPALEKALDLCRSGGADGVLIDDFDRLSRRSEVIPLQVLLDLQACGCGLWEPRGGKVHDLLQATVRASVASEAHQLMVERLRLGRERAKARRVARNPARQ